MTQIALTSLACPLDGQPLARDNKRFTCSAGHSFDLAKRGYLHLLPAQHKRSKAPGDSVEMIQARQRFLERGFYRELASALADVSALANEVNLLDAGCGEGYYLRQLETLRPEVSWIGAGLDISKPAIDSAAKCEKGFQYLVASNANIPLLDHSVDVLWCVFGFADFEQFRRVLKPSGRLIMVDPGVNHLLALREVIYPKVVDKANERTTPEGFRLLEKQHIAGEMTLDQTALADLLLMTPHLFRANREGRERAAALDALQCQYDIELRVFCPTN